MAEMFYYLGLTGIATVCMQLSFFAIASTFKFDKVTDFAGSMNFALLAWLVYLIKGTHFTRQTVATIFVSIWAVRLGFFLLNRVLKREKDGRFDGIRENFLRFLFFWVIQMIWVWTVSLPVTLVNASSVDVPLNRLDYAGWAIWVVGFLCEAVADHQRYSRTPLATSPSKQSGDFEGDTGLWHYSRHPNYFGEIIMWLGLFLSSCSVFGANSFTSGYAIAAASPLLTFILLAFISGIPLAEVRADKRYQDSADYKRYKLSTSPLVPLPPSFYSLLPIIVRRLFFFEFKMYWKRFNKSTNNNTNVSHGSATKTNGLANGSTNGHANGHATSVNH